MSDVPVYVLERSFDAPRELVWRTWTEPDLISRWYGPRVETITHRLDAKPGGLWLNEMKWGDTSHYQRVEYTEVTPPERLVWMHSVSDADWNVIANPMMPDWPRVLLTNVTFEEDDAGSTLKLTWTPHEASAAEITCFSGAMAGLDQGWGAGMELLTALLAELRA